MADDADRAQQLEQIQLARSLAFRQDDSLPRKGRCYNCGEPLASEASYVLCTSAAGLRERLAPFGVVVRDCASFGLVGQARVAVPSEEGLDRLADALEASAR